jgi:hypothetical protein
MIAAPLETTRPASTNDRNGDEEPFKVRKRDGDEGGEAPLKVVPSAGLARRACCATVKRAEPLTSGRGHDGEGPRRWPSATAQSEISEPNPHRARNRQPQIIDDGMQPKPAIFALSRACIARGTGSSDPSPSSGESTNFQLLARCDCDGETRFIALAYGKFESSSLQQESSANRPRSGLRFCLMQRRGRFRRLAG